MGQNLYKSKRKERNKIFKRIVKVNLMLKNGSDRHNIKSKIYCNTIIFILKKSNLLIILLDWVEKPGIYSIDLGRIAKS